MTEPLKPQEFIKQNEKMIRQSYIWFAAYTLLCGFQVGCFITKHDYFNLFAALMMTLPMMVIAVDIKRIKRLNLEWLHLGDTLDYLDKNYPIITAAVDYMDQVYNPRQAQVLRKLPALIKYLQSVGLKPENAVPMPEVEAAIDAIAKAAGFEKREQW